MAAETGFEIDGSRYEVPTLDSLNMDEAQVLYDYSGLAVEDFVPPRPDMDDDDKLRHQESIAQRMKNPGLLKALLHIAYQRGNTHVRPSRVGELVGQVNVFDAVLSLVSNEPEEDDVPLASTPRPEESSLSGSGGSSMSSGEGSGSDSDAPDAAPATTGHMRSDTSLMSDRKLSAA